MVAVCLSVCRKVLKWKTDESAFFLKSVVSKFPWKLFIGILVFHRWDPPSSSLFSLVSAIHWEWRFCWQVPSLKSPVAFSRISSGVRELPITQQRNESDAKEKEMVSFICRRDFAFKACVVESLFQELLWLYNCPKIVRLVISICRADQPKHKHLI